MARGGIYKSEVLRARDRLLAQGRNPSIDAVRVELGNTGSKATIHRYLKEIEEEEGGTTGTKVAVSDALQDLVGRLAARLHEESDALINEASSSFKAQAAQQAEALAAAQKEGEAFRLQLERSQVALVEEQVRHAATAVALQEATVDRAKLTQQVADLQARLATEADHLQSLEDKHQQARTALEHFRQAAKEQREQTQRQHDQQMQFLQGELRVAQQAGMEKLHELTQSHQDNARLSGELSQARRDLFQAREAARTLSSVQEALSAAEKDAEELRRRLAEELAVVQAAHERDATNKTLVATLQEALRRTEIDLAGAQASLATQTQLIENLRPRFPRRRIGDRSEIGINQESLQK